MKISSLIALCHLGLFSPLHGDIPADLEKIFKNSDYIFLGKAIPEEDSDFLTVSVFEVYKDKNKILGRIDGRKTKLAENGQLFLEVKGKFVTRSFRLTNKKTFLFNKKFVDLADVRKYFKMGDGVRDPGKEK